MIDVLDKNNKVEQASQLSDEQIAANLNLDAAIQELPVNDSQGQEQQELGANAVDSLTGLLSLVPIVLGFAGLKHTAKIWTETTIRGLSVAVVPVLRKHAWGMKIINFLETGAGVEEMALFAVAMPIGLATYGAYSMDVAEKRAAENKVDDDTVLTPNPARASNGIERANASDIDYANKN